MTLSDVLLALAVGYLAGVVVVSVMFGLRMVRAARAERRDRLYAEACRQEWET